MSSYSLTFPPELDTEQVVAWLHTLGGLLPGRVGRLYGVPVVVLEVSATAAHGLRYQLYVPSIRADYIIGQLRVALPGVHAVSVSADTSVGWNRVIEFGMRRLARTLHVEPAVLAASLLASLRGFGLRTGETIALQWVIRPATPERPPSLPPRTSRNRRSWLAPPPARDAVEDRRTKLTSVNFLGVLRVAVAARSDARVRQLLGDVRTALLGVRGPGNALIVRRRWQVRVQRDFASQRVPLFFSMQLTAQELAGLLAWPIGAPHVAGLPQARSRQLPPSGAIAREGLVLARATFPGAERPLALTPLDACKHLHIVGPTGVGKTALAGNMAVQAMNLGAGVVVMESKGDLFELVLDAVPRNRRADVIVVDVSDDHPVGYNLLGEGNPRIAVEELCQLFEYLYPDMRRGVWARAALYRGLSTLVTQSNAAFIDLVPLLSPSSRSEVERQWRDELVASVTDPELVRFWQRFDGLSASQQEAYTAPILDRVWQLNERPEIRRIIGQSASSFSFREVLRSRHILLVNLAGLGIETARLMGTLLLNSLWSAVRSGAADPTHPTVLVLDELQDFMNLPIDPETMLVRARSYGLAMVLAHQHLDQLPAAIRSAVLANARSKVVFQATADDARVLAREFGKVVSEDDFLHLAQYEVLCRLATAEGVSPPVSGVTMPPPGSTESAAAVRNRSRARYGRDVEAIEADIAARRTPQHPVPTKRPRLGGSSWDG